MAELVTGMFLTRDAAGPWAPSSPYFQRAAR